jgi:hypothetical protein
LMIDMEVSAMGLVSSCRRTKDCTEGITDMRHVQRNCMNLRGTSQRAGTHTMPYWGTHRRVPRQLG